jgi:hypothetical protein
LLALEGARRYFRREGNVIFDRGFVAGTGARTRKLLLAGTALATVVLLPSLAQAQVWNGTSTDYNTPGNWSTGTVPDTAGETATFSNTGSNVVDVSLGPIAPQSWTFDATSQSYAIAGQDVNFVTGITNNASAGAAIFISNLMTGTTLSQAGASPAPTASPPRRSRPARSTTAAR